MTAPVNSTTVSQLESNAPVLKEDKSPLVRYFIDLIKMTGPLSVATYMKQALIHPLGGYYMKSDVFGQQGDFTTSPEISQLFGEVSY